MAHWAEIDENKIVVRVTVGDNNDPNGDEGYQWLIDNLGGTWIQTSYNSNFRGKFAAIGDTYNQEIDKFIAKQPFASWVLNESFDWEAPIPYPDDGLSYNWNQTINNWEVSEDG